MAKYKVEYTALCTKTCIVEANSCDEAESIVRDEDYTMMKDVEEHSEDVDSVDFVGEI